MPVMAPPPAGDGSNVIRRSIYQNANTMVELLIKSKEPRLRPAAGGSTAGRSTAASAPAWPAAVPVRRDGRPLSAHTLQLPARPRTGRQLPAWQPAGDQLEGRGSSPERPPAGRGGRQPAGRPGPGGVVQRQRRAPAARGQPLLRPGQGAGPGRPASGRTAGGAESEPAEQEHGTSEEFTAWTAQLSKLVQEIRKRPATAHLRPLLSRLEETVRVPPAIQSAGDDHDPLRVRLEEIQQENEELQRKFQTLSAAMREYQQQRLADGDGGGVGGGEASSQDRVRRAEAEAELVEVKRQLAKYKKYAKELRKTKENLLNTIQTLDESHVAELKGQKEEHETQMAHVLAQFSSETEMLVSFRADAEAVQRSLALRVRENSELQSALAERDTEVERLAALNQSLHDLALKQLQQLASSNLPSLSQLMTKLQSPSGGGGCCGVVGPGQDGAGDGAARPPWRDISLLLNLDVTEPLPPRPFPRDWADLSLASLVGSAAAGAGAASEGSSQRMPGDGDRDRVRRPPSGGAADPPPGTAGSRGGGGGGGSQRQVAGGGTDSRPQQEQRQEQWQEQRQEQQQQQQQRQSSGGGTNRRLFGGDGDQVEGGVGDQRLNSGGRSDQMPDRSGRGDQMPDRSGRGDQMPDRSGGGDPMPFSGDRVGQSASSISDIVDQCGPVGGDGAGDCRRPAPVGSHTSEEGFQRSLARLDERLTELQQGISRASQVLTP